MSLQTSNRANNNGFPFYDLFGKFRKTRMLGKGAFADVYEVKSKDDEIRGINQSYAMKIIDDMFSKEAKHEVGFYTKLKQLDPENKSFCIHLIESWIFKGSYSCLLFPKLNASLYAFQQNNGVFMIEQIRDMMYQILFAIGFLHENKLAHRDLKLDNILLMDATYTVSADGKKILNKTDLKIIDFGLYIDTKSNPTGKGIIQNLHYRAPEIFLEIEYNHEAIDLWSIGVILFKMYMDEDLLLIGQDRINLYRLQRIVGTFPQKLIDKSPLKAELFHENGTVKIGPGYKHNMFYEDEKVTKKLANIDSKATQLCQLMRELLELDPDKRITAKQALQHPFLTSGLKTFD